MRIWLVALLCLSLAGCGARGNGISRVQFAREANAICAQGNETVRKHGPEPPILTSEQADWILELTRGRRARGMTRSFAGTRCRSGVFHTGAGTRGALRPWSMRLAWTSRPLRLSYSLSAAW